MRVIIVGAGSVGRQLLSDLSAPQDHEIVVVDVDEQLCGELSEEFDALVINGDAADPGVLEKAQIDEADALVATTGSDAINAVIAMLGHRRGVDKIVVKITNNALRDALEEVGVTDIVAPAVAAAAKIDAALHGTEQRDLSLLAQGGLFVAELRVGRGADGRPLGDVSVPDGLRFVGIMRGAEARIATEGTQLAEGDLVYAIAESDKAADEVRRDLEEG